MINSAAPAPRAICLLSGGLDSSTCLAIARRQGFACFCLSFDYGQRHVVELQAAARVARQLGAVENRVAKIDLRCFGGSALTADIAVPKSRQPEEMSSGIPVTYVPARNTSYPDCRPEFVQAFERLANLATRAGVEGRSEFKIHTPLIQMSKAAIVKQAIELEVDLGLTHSCYDPDASGRPCGLCDSCALRRKGFEEAGVPDPIFAKPETLHP
jgi:7-cyano-7-deazaguanine synthase